MKAFNESNPHTTGGAFPNTQAKTSSTPQTPDGTVFNATYINEIWGFFQAILTRAGVTPNGDVETAANSQLYDGLRDSLVGEGSITTEKLADDAVTEDKLAPNSVNNAQIRTNAITSSKILDGSITTDKLDDKAVERSKIADEAVDTEQLRDESVRAEKIYPNSVTNSKIYPEAVTTAKMRDGAITTAKLDDKAVERSKIADEALIQRHFDREGIGMKDTGVTPLQWLRSLASVTHSSTGAAFFIVINSYIKGVSAVRVTYRWKDANGDDQFVTARRVKAVLDASENELRVTAEPFNQNPDYDAAAPVLVEKITLVEVHPDETAVA